MRRYWADGYNRLDYLELAFLVDHDQLLRRTDLQFYESFQDQALTLWEMISGAFERLENDELADFIVDAGHESALQTHQVECGTKLSFIIEFCQTIL